jgi:hypothetical protein
MTASPEDFITRWQGREGGQERANYAMFLSELCDVLEVRRPDPASVSTAENDYVFERVVKRQALDGAPGAGRIDLIQTQLLRPGSQTIAPGRRRQGDRHPHPARPGAAEARRA